MSGGTFDDKGVFGFFKADFRVVVHRGGGGKQNQGDFFADLRLCAADEFAADALMLAGGIDGKIGQIAGVGEVGKRASNADKVRTVPCRPQDVGLIEHGLQARQVGVGRRMPERSSTPANCSAVMVLLLLYSIICLSFFFRLPFQAAFAFQTAYFHKLSGETIHSASTTINTKLIGISTFQPRRMIWS